MKINIIKLWINELKYWLERFKLKISDYDRLEYDYGTLTCEATNNMMSYSNYYIKDVIQIIHAEQHQLYYDFIKSDIEENILNQELTDEQKLNAIIKYLNI